MKWYHNCPCSRCNFQLELNRGKPIVPNSKYSVKGKCINCYYTQGSIIVDKGKLAQATKHRCPNCECMTMCPSDL